MPDDVLAMYRDAGAKGSAARTSWQRRLDASGTTKDDWDAQWNGDLVGEASGALPTFEAGTSMATRKASQQCVTALGEVLPALIGGSADLTGNTGTKIDDVAQAADTPDGRQIYFGVREHAMAAATVGAARHGGVIPFCGTFLVFADYMRPSVRLAAMSGADVRVRVDPRLGRCRRGRADPPARRAGDEPPGDPRPPGDPPRRPPPRWPALGSWRWRPTAPPR